MPVLDVATPLRSDALTGPARVLYAPITQAVPANIADIVTLVGVSGVYAPVTGWKDFGLATDAPSYSRGIESEGIEYDNVLGPLFEKITSIDRSVTVTVSSINPEALQIIENAATIATIAAAAGKSAQKSVPFGTFEDVTQYRIALLSQRPKAAVAVVEPGGVSRGGLVALALYRCSLAAEDTEMEFAAGEGVGAEVQFTVYPDSAVVNPAEQAGRWLFEQAGTIV